MDGHGSAVLALLASAPVLAQTSARDTIGDLLKRGEAPKAGEAPTAQTPKDPREGDLAYEQAQRLMKVTEESLHRAIEAAREGNRLGAAD